MSHAPLRARGGVVDALSSALDQGGHGLHNVPRLLHRILSEEAWREFETLRGEVVRHARFSDFVTTPPLRGLGTTMEIIRRLVRDEPATLDLLDRAAQNPVGINQYSEGLDNIQTQAPTGTSREASLRRLRKDAPELHAEVLAGRLSAHAAMVKAGFRHRTVSVPVDQPDAVARMLRKNLGADDLAELVRLLTTPDAT